VGSSIALNTKHIAVCPQTTKEEFVKLKKIFKTTGNIATVNYGDGFVGNGMLLNDKGVMIGKRTTGYELIRIDDIFG
jgi:translation initiation factor 6 (eIF-6)